MIKKLSFIIALLFLANSTSADSLTAFSNLSISTADAGSTLSWTVEKSAQKKAEKAQMELLAETSDALNEKLNAKLEKSLEDKFSNQLD